MTQLLTWSYCTPPTPEDQLFGLWVENAGHFISKTHVLESRVMSPYIIIYCVAGAGSFHVMGHETPIRAGDIFCLPPNVEHGYRCDPLLGWDIWWAHFGGPHARNLVQLAGLYAPHMRRIGYQPEIASEFARMLSIMQEKRLHYALDAALAMTSLLAGIKKVNTVIPLKSSSLLAQLDYRITSLEEAAQRCGYSPYHFSRSFKKGMGMSPWQYILMLKVDKAKELLADPRIPIKAVAERVGINDANYFSRLFKKLTGVTPKDFRTAICNYSVP